MPTYNVVDHVVRLLTETTLNGASLDFSWSICVVLYLFPRFFGRCKDMYKGNLREIQAEISVCPQKM